MAGPVYTLGVDDKPKQVHLALYPDFRTRGDLLNYLRQTKLTGWPHESVSIMHMHITLLYSGSVKVPPNFPKEQTLGHPIDLSGFKWPVKPLALGMAKAGSPIAILFPNVVRLRSLSDLFHKQFKLTPNGNGYIYHMTLSNIQEFHPKSKQFEKTPFKSLNSYYHLPPYTGRMVLDELKISSDDR